MTMPTKIDTIHPALPPSDVVRVAVVVARYNAWITDRLRDGAVGELSLRVGERGEAVVIPVPGAFELPVAAAVAARSGRFHAVVTLGCIIKGETVHDEVIAHAVAGQIAAVGVETGLPVVLGVLTVNTAAQAEARAGGAAGNKGAEAMSAALDTLGALTALRRLHEG
jgi:6,7-dimethyl-8-ribityllumazine synthase